MTTRRFTFDGAVVHDDGLSFRFKRDATTIVERGGRNLGQVGANVPVFGDPRLICGAPVVTTIAGTTSEANDLMAIGVDADGVTPVYLVKKPSSGTLTIYVGDLSGGGYQYNIQTNGSKDNQIDFLRESADNQATEAWNPKAAVICHGVIILSCNVHHNDGTNWGHRRLGLATCKISDLAGAKSGWWRRHAVTDVLPGMNGKTGPALNAEMNTSYSMQTYMVMDRTGARPVKAWVAGVEYQTGQVAVGGGKFGGVYWVMPLTRPDTSSGAWTVDAPYELHRFSRGVNSSHAHGVVLSRSGTLGIVAVMSRGDASGNNCNYARRLASEGSATAASTAYRTGASLPNNGGVSAVNYYSGGAAWAAIEYVNGVIDDEGSSDINDAPTGERRPAMQGMGLHPGPTSGTVLITTDDVDGGPLMLASVPSSGGTIKWRTLATMNHCHLAAGKSSATSAKMYFRNLCFNARGASPESLYGPLVLQVSPSEFAYTRDRNCRVLYSPNSQDFGQCWAHRVVEQVPVIIDPIRGRVWAGDANNVGLGIRWIPTPRYVVRSPLKIANGAKNYLKTQASGDGTVRPASSGHVTATFQPALPTGASAPPVLGNNVWKIQYDGTAGSGDVFVWWLTDVYSGGNAIPAATKAVKVRLWVLLEPPETYPGTPKATGCNSAGAVFRFRGRFTDSVGPYLAGYTNNIQHYDNSAAGWIPVEIEFDPSAIKAFSGNYGMELFLESGGGAGGSYADPQQTPLNFYVAFESVTTSDAVPYAVAPQTTGDNELAAMVGFSAAGSFTMAAMGEVPPNASWDWASPCALTETAATAASATTTVLTNGTSTNGDYVGCRLWAHDTSKIASGDFGLLITAYDGATKTATHAAHTGALGSGLSVDVLRPCLGFDASNPGFRPLWSGCDASAATGFTVFADTGGGRLAIAAWNGSAYGTPAFINNVHWLGGSPVLTVVTYDAATATLTLRASAGGIEIDSASVASVTFSAALTELRLASLNASPTVTPMSWYGGFVDDASALSPTGADAELVSVASPSGSSGSTRTWQRLPRLAT